MNNKGLTVLGLAVLLGILISLIILIFWMKVDDKMRVGSNPVEIFN